MKPEPAKSTDAKSATGGGFFSGGGDMGERIRAFDWAASPLGPVSGWPGALASTLSICLNSRFPMAIYWGEQGYLLYNDAWRPILGEKHPWALGLGARDVWPEIWGDIAPLFASVRETGEGTWRGDALLPMHRSGYTEECYFDYTFNPIVGKSGRVEGILNVVQETTHRVLNDRRTRLLHELASATADAKTTAQVCKLAARTLQGFVHDVPFALIYLLSGQSAHLAASSGLALGDAAAPELITLDAGHQAWPLSQAMEDKVHEQIPRDKALSLEPWPEPTESVLMLPLKHGAFDAPLGFLVAGTSPRRALDDSYEAFFDLLAGSIAGSIGNARAFETERNRAEALAELDRAKTDFFSNVSHELRTPLTLILGPLEEQLREDPQNSRVELAHRNSLRLLRLVNTLLDFSRIEAGRIQATYQPIDLAAFTAELASGFRSAIEGAGLQLVVDCPPLPEPLHVDVEMWEKIVLNLLSNAFKFTFEGAITVTLQWHGDAAELIITDTGTGIPATELPHIFERFHRVRGTRSRTHEGTGIGLALVGELARLHGGAVEVMSEEGRGSTFRVRISAGTAHLPAEHLGTPASLAPSTSGMNSFIEEAQRWQAAPNEKDAKSTPDTIVSVTDDQAGAPAHILLADDNADMRDYVTRLLTPHYAVTAVADGRSALDAARSKPPDLVLADVMMPRLDGFEMLRELRADPALQTLPVILLSARAGEESRVEGMRQGADDYLVKPFIARELLARVEAHLKLARVRRESADALSKAKETAEAANRAKDDFLAALSHELRTPLNPVLLASGEMSKDPALPAETREQLVMIQRNIQLEARLIDDLLDLTRISRGVLRLETSPTDAHVLLDHVREIVRPDADSTKVEVTFSLDAADHHLLGDAARLQQVFWNLIKNAIKFSAGVGRVSIRTSNPAPGRLAITVADTGVGIAEEALARIFLPFEQGETDSQHRFGGLGLGLAISKAIVDLHGGHLLAQSAGPGKGATFTVELATAAVPEPQPSKPATPAPRDKVSPLNLLLVEDHEPTMGILTRLLQRDGHCVHAARSLTEALALASDKICDLVISDLGLPDGSGLDLMRTLSHGRGWHGIALSGYGTDEDVRASRAAGFKAHLLKPVDMDDLRRAIQEVQTGSRA